ncbi:phosphate/phosphite/phosphonate ABC transporter substrate-binding protein [Sulfurirhabdus autotrophica]|nr:phosphate/phosphite/phosphonate ABC transporter substrate-binding protein [Sulfurirhabdus autotrophica]
MDESKFYHAFKWWKLAIFVVFFIAIAFPFQVLAVSDPNKPPLTFGVFPRWNAQIMVRNFSPLAHVLSQSLGREVRVETDKDFNSFMARVRAGEFDIVYLNQLQYVQAHQAAGYIAIAKLCESPECTISAAIVVRNDGGIKNIADLRGKTIAFGDRNAMVSYVLAKSVLQAAGLPQDQYRMIFTKNPPNALFAVYNSEAQAAGVGSSVFSHPEIVQRVDKTQLRVLIESKPIPQLPLAVRRDMDPQLVNNIMKVLLQLHRHMEGVSILKKLNADRFEVANDAEYAMLKSLLETADAGN